MLAPLVAVQPIYLISETVFPVLIGMFGFGERKHLREGEELAFAMGAIGALLVIVGFISQ